MKMSSEAMKMASTMYSSCIQIPYNVKIYSLNSCPFTCRKIVPRPFVLQCSHHAFSGGGFSCGEKYYDSAVPGIRKRCVIAYSEPKHQASNSASEASRFQPPDDTSGDDISFYDNSTATSGEVMLRTGDFASSLRTVALCVFSAVVFGVGLGFKDGGSKSSEFFAGYLLEQSLSVDNLFVFVLIFKYFKVPLAYQNRVLSYGIAGAIVFRLSLILIGAATIQKYEVVNLFLAVILLYSSFKLFTEEDEGTDLSDNFIVKTCQKFIPVTSMYDGDRFFTTEDGIWKATPLLLTVAVIELSDIAFAVDSIPAVFGVTRDPFIVFTSNLFAILGLRSYYNLISQSMGDLDYLQVSTSQREVSLGFVATTLLGGVALSLIKKSS